MQRSLLLRMSFGFLTVLTLGLVLVGGGVSGEDIEYGIGTWIDVVPAPDLCGQPIYRLCAEFEDGLGGVSPHHGTVCCIDASDRESLSFDACKTVLRRNPRD